MIEKSYLNKNGYKRYYDAQAKTACLNNGDMFINYEDKEAPVEEVKYIKCKEHREHLLPLLESGFEACRVSAAVVNKYGEIRADEATIPLLGLIAYSGNTSCKMVVLLMDSCISRRSW